ncbi:transglutaminase family protein [Mycobacterium sp. M26]|uniref:transglutaminase-like domain-containing protein n=1 Tax=Mycobacterium sp. M26 TaxID=1762962 RepID=UPI00073F8D29|nr:transglutaminase family protein [Mycobacterium sp. M26]
MTTREFGADLEVAVIEPAILEFQITLAQQTGADVTETLEFQANGKTVHPEVIVGDVGSRIHRFAADKGTVTARYRATAVGASDPSPVTDFDLTNYLRPSRYAESDKFFGFAATEFGEYASSVTVLEKVSSWVGTRLDYVPGSSDPIDGAVDTLLAGRGVCRDYAHLVVALLRAVKVPARLAAVYAPGCEPMDFHAVAEALVDGAWRVVDATCLAPRQSMMRIATGRDAADTAFLDNHGGAISLEHMEVTAVVDGDLPRDAVTDLVSLR